MEGQIERLLPFMADWGGATFAALVVGAIVAIAWLIRGQPGRAPTGAFTRLAIAALVLCVVAGSAGLWAVLGPMRPMLGQVRALGRIVDHPAGELAFRAVADDSPHRLSELRGKVVVLNLWATWCGPCRRELPEVQRLQRDFASRGLVVLTVSTEERERLRAFTARYPLETLNGYTPGIKWLDVSGRPISLVIDRDGTVRECFIGARTYTEFERAVTRLTREVPSQAG